MSYLSIDTQDDHPNYQVNITERHLFTFNLTVISPLKTVINLALFFVLQLCWFGLSAQSSYFRNYSVEHGLPFVQVQTIFQDSKGYLWSGGYGGLSRFDGNTFINFSPRNGLVSHSVTTIAEDKKGNLWVGTTSGLSCYDGVKFTNFTTADGLPDNYITYIIVDGKDVWIGTLNGIVRFNGEIFEVFNKGSGFVTNKVYSVYKDPQGRFWIGSEHGLILYDGKLSLHKISSDTSLNIYAITSDKEGSILCATDKGIYVFDPGKRSFSLFADERVRNLRINTLVKDRRGVIWAGTSEGLYRISSKGARKYLIEGGQNNNNIICLFVDYEGNLWTGTYNGMFRYRDDQFTTYTTASGLRSQFVFQITRDTRDRMWIATTDGLHIYDGKKFTVLDKKNGLLSNSIISCFSDRDGDMWVGSDKGIDLFTKNGKKSYTKANGLVSDSACIITQDSKGRMLIGGSMGITIYENGVFTKHRFTSPYSDDFTVWKILEISSNRYIVTTYKGGIFEFDGKNFRNINSDLGIKENVVLDAVTDKEGILYFATFDGVFMYIPETYPNKKVKRLVRFNEGYGLSSDLTYCLSFDQSFRYLWVGTNQGLNRIDIAAYKKRGTKKIEVFGKEDGFMGVESNTNGIYPDKDGSIWFGTVNGLIQYNPYEYVPNSYEPRINLTNIRLFYQDTTFTQNLELPYDQNHLSFTYAATSLTNPAKVQYRIMLEGFDKAWSPVTRSNFATYSNLPPGQYTFKVLAANNEGIWSRYPATYSFRIREAWWNTWLFRGFTVAAIATAVIVGFRIRAAQIRKKERLMAKRNLEIARLELKALRAQMNPHFIFNSLNSIQHFIMQSEEASAVKYLNKFAKLIRIILNNSEKPAITLREEIEALELYMQLEELRFSEKFGYKISVDHDIDIDYYEVPPLILQPYVENAILHGLNPKAEKGLLEVVIRREGTYIICTVKDNGIGRKQAMRMKGEVIKKHVSHGTRITRERLEILNRSFHSELSVNITDLEPQTDGHTGTKVDVFIPA